MAPPTKPRRTKTKPPGSGGHDQIEVVAGLTVRNGIRGHKADAKLPASVLDERGCVRASIEIPKERNKGEATVFIGDCRDVLAKLPQVQRSELDLVFADPPFNWNRGYDKWDDNLPKDDYKQFTYDWLDLCHGGLRPGGALWVNIPDDWAAEIVVFLKQRNLTMRNWCIWHYRFGQNTTERFINSKVHALYFTKAGGKHTWNTGDILEYSDRASTYFDPRTLDKKDGMPAGMRVPLDVWYGPYLGRVQGNSKERRNYHDNQLPEAYLHRVIASTSNKGNLVLDPFLGSGTTGVMARALHRNFIGVEFSPLNAANALARIQDGPVRSYGEPTSSAIFTPRTSSGGARARIAKKVGTRAVSEDDGRATN
jgi:DNA modification methylase